MIGLAIAGVAIILFLCSVVSDEIPTSWPSWRITRLEKPRTFWSYVIWYGIVAVIAGIYGVVSLARL